MEKIREIFKTDSKMPKECSMGVSKESDGIRFTLDVPYGKKAEILIYHKSDLTLIQCVPFPEKSWYGTIQTVKVLGLDWKQYVYQYRISDEIVMDSYAVAVNQDYSEMNFARFSWGNSVKPGILYEDGIMYHLHVHNYTMHEKSGVRHKGTFLGLQEKIPYLKKLGINQLLLMPVYDFDEKPELPEKHHKKHCAAPIVQNMNYWGYKKGYYMAPKKAFCATDDPVKEFKSMVKAFHLNQIEIILELFFEADLSLTYQIHCLKNWIKEYQIDGFRIMGNTEIVKYLIKDPFFADTKIISDYIAPEWLPEELSGYRNFAEMNNDFCNDCRRILKGDEGLLNQMAFRTRRNPSGYGVLNYMTGHDGFTLQDLVSYDRKHNEDNQEQNRDGCETNYSWNCGAEGDTKKRDVIKLRNRQKRNAMLLMLLSQGTPVLLAGDEFCNSQKGNNNPYCLDNEISWTDWGAYRKNNKFFQFVKDAIEFRKQHKVLHRDKECVMNDYKACGYPDLSYHSSKAWYGEFEYNCRQIGMLYCGSYANEDEFIYVLYNLNPEEQVLALPKLPEKMSWYVCADTMTECGFTEDMPAFIKSKKTTIVPARTIVILISKRE